MKAWYVALAGAVLTAMVIVPKSPQIEQAVAPEAKSSSLSSLKLDRMDPEITFASREPISAFATAHKPLEGVRICVDPGHGGQYLTKTHYTGGTIGVATGQTESDVNLRVSLCLKQYLEAAGASVVLTRHSDTRCTNDPSKCPELDFRSSMANSRNCDLFISVHHNEATNRNANHTVVFYPPGMTKSVALAENISAAVGNYLGTQNLGAKPGSYRVLKGVKMAGVIVEASFMSNPSEDQRLASVAYNKLEAKAIATGILNYMKLTRGRQVDFNTIFSPIDSQAGSAQAIADASFVRREVVERRSLFGVRYEEVTYDGAGRVTGRREIGGSSVASKKSSGSSKSKSTASSKSKSKSSKSASKSSSKSSRSTRVTITPSKSSKSKSSKTVASASKSSKKK
jgi:N-acetylmuramoyl-L-alanine amidase